MSTSKSNIKFKKLKFNETIYGPIAKAVFVALDNGRSVLDNFQDLSQDQCDEIITLISKMATVTPNLKSNKVRWKLANRTYGEIKPRGHRFFFFTIIDKNIIFFDYREKKQNNLQSNVYKSIQNNKERYEDEFRKQHPEYCRPILR